MALVLALPLVTGRVPLGEGLQALVGSRQVQPTAFQLPALTAAPAASRRLAVPVVAGEGPYRITPERRALLNTIRFAEGTWTAGSPVGYRMLYGGGQVEDLTRHPEIIVVSGYRSAAAGAYQFLPDTWHEAARRLRLRDFRPGSQDQAALYLVEKRGALQRFDRQGLSHDVLARLAPEWASLPTQGGGSYYGQPVKDGEELRRFYSSELARQRSLRLI